MAIGDQQGPQPSDIALMMQRASAGASSSGGDGDKNQFETITDGLATMLSRLLGKVGIKIRLRTLGSTSMFAQFTPSKSWSGESMNAPAATFSPKGGVVASLITKTQFKMDFSNIVKPEIYGFPVESMSYASLGNLSSQDFGGGGKGGIGLA